MVIEQFIEVKAVVVVFSWWCFIVVVVIVLLVWYYCCGLCGYNFVHSGHLEIQNFWLRIRQLYFFMGLAKIVICSKCEYISFDQIYLIGFSKITTFDIFP